MNIIFDLDGTLANCEHRRHLVTKDRKDPRWKEFYNRCGSDTPIDPVIKVFRALQYDDMEEHDIRIWSGRCESTRRVTVGWLLDWVSGCVAKYMYEPHLRMRPVGNTEPDDVIKERWLRESIADGWKPDLVFDDRAKVVRMWRNNGIICAQVAPGEF
jgi:hypothetical protein